MLVIDKPLAKQLVWCGDKPEEVKFGAKVVAHDRYVTFQMAEVAVPRDLFRSILQLIDGLRQPSPTVG